MESKTVILSVLIMCLVMAQIQVEARRVCCPSLRSRAAFNLCRQRRRPTLVCAAISRCRIVRGNRCPRRLPYYDTLENSGGNDVNEYCNLECESSVCDALTTLETSDASEIVNEALDEKCTKACSTFCGTDSKIALDQVALDQIALDQSA